MEKQIIPFYIPSGKILVRSKDCYLYDSDGKEYVDFEAGVWCVNVGHSNERIVKLIAKQTSESIHHGYKFRNKLSEDLSGKLQSLIGIENGASVFLSSGSEAVNLAITLSNYITGRDKILKIDNSYLSAYGHGQISPNNSSVVNVYYNNPDSINAVNFREISAFVMETGGASIDVVKFPKNEFIKEIVHLAREYNCLIIADEVTTGLGRTGKWFGFQHYDVNPDMVVTGKALGNGYPVSGLTITYELASFFRNKPFRYAQSHQNDPLGCALGLEVIEIIEEENLIEVSQKTGEYFRKQLDAILLEHCDMVKDIRSRGLMLALEFQDHIDGEFISNRLFSDGFVSGFKENTLRFIPPLTIKNPDIDRLAEKINELLFEISEK